jgi:sortase A
VRCSWLSTAAEKLNLTTDLRAAPSTIDPTPGGSSGQLAGRRKRKHSIVGLLGKLCLLAALGVVGYMVWLFWGTGLQTAHAQHGLRADISGEIRRARHASIAPAPPRYLRDGHPMAIIRIPRIHLDMVVVEGTTTADLTRGPGHYRGTAYPWASSGRVVISGHRTTYLHPFWGLDKLQPGDLIWLITPYGTFEYHVTGSSVVLPQAGWVFKQTAAPTLALTTCTPRFSASHRLVVLARR